MGAHPRRSQALLHAVLEAAERDRLAIALPEGWNPAAIRTRKIAPGTLPARVSAICERLRQNGLEAHCFDLSDALPVAAAILIDLEEGPVPATAGYACAMRPDDALLGAVLEAAQSLQQRYAELGLEFPGNDLIHEEVERERALASYLEALLAREKSR